MATGNVVLKIEGLGTLQALVERLEKAIEQVSEIERPLYGDIHISTGVDADAVLRGMRTRLSALNGVERGDDQ